MRLQLPEQEEVHTVHCTYYFDESYMYMQSFSFKKPRKSDQISHQHFIIIYVHASLLAEPKHKLTCMLYILFSLN